MSDFERNLNCALCGKPKRDNQSGTLTGWIFDSSGCRCDAFLQESQAVTTPIVCLNCRLPIARGKKATITQWIFPSSACSCQTPNTGPDPRCQPVDFGDSTSQASDDPEVQEIASVMPERYTILGILGRGAVSVVTEARDNFLNRLVAVKIFERSTMESDQLVRFQSEAKIIGKMEHPNVVQVYDFGINEIGKPFMVLEHVRGTTLADLLDHRGTLTSREAYQVFSGVASALAYAYENGFSHRDLKPSNLLIHTSDTGVMTAKVIDFGLAKYTSKDDSLTTGNGIPLIGTAAYMSPDQANGLQFDVRSEIYSFGCVLFEALTGKPPFSADSPLELISKHAHDQASYVSDLNSQIDEALSLLIKGCLSKSPEDRFQSFDEILDVIENRYLAASDAGLEDRPTIHESTSFGPSTFRPRLIALLVVALFAALLTPFFTNTKQVSSPNSSRPYSSKPTRSASLEGVFNDDIGGVFYSPDAKVVRARGSLRLEDYKQILKYPQAQHFRAFQVPFVNQEGMKLIAKIPWRTVNLCGSDADDSTVETLSRIPTLEGVFLSNTEITDKGLKQLTELKRLNHLRIDHCKVSDAGIESLAKCSALRTLSMRDVHVTRNGIKALCHLDLKVISCTLTADDDIRAACHLKATHYAFANSGWNDRKVRLFRNLRAVWVDLVGNDIGMDGISTLLKLPLIERLNFSSRQDITLEKVDRLKQEMHKNCVVKIYDRSQHPDDKAELIEEEGL